ncbi:MAG TPA: Sec-independent protein translocase protein TatB, partial [Jatrophihabitantaceae bacterium]|nr:Sec-independent protein translocase protein TatB [Jatrophihabitantaceae bacterium]
MFNIGPWELLVLAFVGVIVLGPERLPALARDAANMLRQLRDLATGARNQLKNELGPEFSDVDLQALRDLRALNPRTAITRVLLGDDEDAGVAATQP